MENRDWGIRSLITFHNKIDSAQSYAHEHNDYRQAMGLKPIHTDNVRGKDKARKRIKALEALGPSQPPALVSNARCLTEGIDVPTLSGVAFIEPRRSPIDIAQAIGRAIRKPHGSDKSVGYIVVPIYIPLSCYSPLMGATGSDEDVAALLEGPLNAAFTPLIEVIHGLRNFDEPITEIINDYRIARGARSSVRGQTRLIGERHSKETKEGALPITVDYGGITRNDPLSDQPIDLPTNALDMSAFMKALSVLCIDDILERCTDSWFENLGKVKRFLGENGNVYPTDQSDKQLKTWISAQRSGKDRLSLERYKLLEELPNWTWTPEADKWPEKWKRTLEFVKKYDRFPHKKASDPEERTLASWVENQQGFKQRKDPVLTPERIRLCEQIPRWEWREKGTRYSKLWRQQFDNYRRWVEQHGAHPQAAGTGYVTNFEQERLADWAQKQRKSRRNAESAAKSTDPEKRKSRGRALSGEEIALLDSLQPPFIWNTQEVNDDSWDSQVDDLENDITTYGHYPRGKTKLARFCLKQLQRVARGTMEAHRIERLEQLPGWDKRLEEYLTESANRAGQLAGEKLWTDTYNRVAQFAMRNHRLPRGSQHDSDEDALGRWVYKRLKEYFQNASTLNQNDRRRRLEKLPGWDERYKKYQERTKM